ncbi:MAG: ribosome maturation factor RimM [Spirochaetes bacterium]|nr:ribosome maturation factor RimM [Spirochaetota bacterium]MBU0955012.1 ribosome maturation factor RimM [Spirochaetota bacterium]
MDKLAVGKIAKPFGVHGWMKVLSYSGETGHFGQLKSIAASDANRSMTLLVEGFKDQQDGSLIMKFRSYDSPETARILCGLELLVPRDQAAPCKSGEYYYADLAGCKLVHEGRELAEVRGVMEGGVSGFLLEAVRDGVQLALIPFQDPFIGDVDIGKRTIELRTPWVLD